MRLKFWAFIYRLTGYYSNYARLQEYKHVKEHWHVIEVYMEYMSTVENAAGLLIGGWQARNGFYRSSKHLKESLRKIEMKKDTDEQN